jgi:hypothetical protein
MSKEPAILFYMNDWIGSIMGISFERKDAYKELLSLQFNSGHMSLKKGLHEPFGKNILSKRYNIDVYIKASRSGFANEIRIQIGGN